jgi:hypothetical protein
VRDVPRVANTNFVLGRPLSSSDPATFQQVAFYDSIVAGQPLLVWVYHT